MPYFANSNGPVFAEPSRDAARLRTFPPGIQLHATGNTFDDDGHVHWVEIRLPSSLVTGWISTLDFTEKPVRLRRRSTWRPSCAPASPSSAN